MPCPLFLPQVSWFSLFSSQGQGRKINYQWYTMASTKERKETDAAMEQPHRCPGSPQPSQGLPISSNLAALAEDSIFLKKIAMNRRYGGKLNAQCYCIHSFWKPLWLPLLRAAGERRVQPLRESFFISSLKVMLLTHSWETIT